MTNAYEQRERKLRTLLESDDLDALLLHSDGRHHFTGALGTDAVRWLSGFKAMAPSLVLMPRESESVLLITPSEDGGRAARRSRLEQVVATDDLVGSFATISGQSGLQGKRLGFVGYRRVSKLLRSQLLAVLGTEPVDLDAAMDELAASKDELELEHMRQAADIAEAAYQHLLEAARPGMAEYQLAAEVDARVKALGADDNFQMLCASIQNSAVRVPNDRVLARGDVVICEISPSVAGDFVQICRTAVLGPASDLQIEQYGLLVHAYERGLEAGKAGVRGGAIVAAINEPLVAAGYEKYCFPPYMRVRGHGVGLGSVRPGDLTLENDVRLESGMSFVLHPNQLMPGSGYLMVGEPVVVTADRLEPLTRRSPRLDSIPM